MIRKNRSSYEKVMACRSWELFWEVTINRLAYFGNLPEMVRSLCYPDPFPSDPARPGWPDPDPSSFSDHLRRWDHPRWLRLLLLFLPINFFFINFGRNTLDWKPPERRQFNPFRSLSSGNDGDPNHLGFVPLLPSKGSVVVDHHNTSWFGRIEALKSGSKLSRANPSKPLRVGWFAHFCWANCILNHGN